MNKLGKNDRSAGAIGCHERLSAQRVRGGLLRCVSPRAPRYVREEHDSDECEARLCIEEANQSQPFVCRLEHSNERTSMPFPSSFQVVSTSLSQPCQKTPLKMLMMLTQWTIAFVDRYRA